MDPSQERLLRSMHAAGVRRMPAPRAGRPAPPQPGPRATPAAAAQRERAVSGSAPGLFAAPRLASLPPVADPEAELAAVAREVEACRACKLCGTRTRAVPGEGATRARIVFVGEGPGADEDRTGRPFVGRAGQLLDDIIVKGMQLQRADVFICNVVKCRPPGNRVPEPDEAEACAGFLDRQLAAIRPAVICALGATAVRRLLRDDRPLGALRGRTWDYRGVPVIATYHPAYLLRNPSAKVQTWQDIRRVMELARKA